MTIEFTQKDLDYLAEKIVERLKGESKPIATLNPFDKMTINDIIDEGYASMSERLHLFSRMKEDIRRSILLIIEGKRMKGDVLPYATSIELAPMLKMSVREVEKIAKDIDGIVIGRAENYDYYYE